MNSSRPYARYSTLELSHLIEDIDEDENPEQYAEITEEIERRTTAGEPYSPRGVTILVLGIVGLVLSLMCGILGVIVALVAWSMGDTALKQIKAVGYDDSVEINNVRIGRICGVMGALIYLASITLKWLTNR